MTAPDQTTAAAAVNELRVAINWLIAVLVPGTHKPYKAPTLSPELRAERDREARLERLERSNLAPGEVPAPLDLAVADLLAEILTCADDLADLVSDTAKVARMPPAPFAFTDPDPYLIHVLDLLPACRGHPHVPRRVEGDCDDLTFRTHEQLGLLGDGQVLAAVCPWCAGRTASKPVGGERTLRVRAQLPRDVKSVVAVPPEEVRWLVICESGTCEPPEADCGERLRGRPAWPLRTEGDWLAQRIESTASA